METNNLIEKNIR